MEFELSIYSKKNWWILNVDHKFQYLIISTVLLKIDLLEVLAMSAKLVQGKFYFRNHVFGYSYNEKSTKLPTKEIK